MLILIDVQYLQNAVSSIKRVSIVWNHCSSEVLRPINKFPPTENPDLDC